MGKFAVDGLSGWHVVGVELDAVDGETTVHLEAFGINPNDHPDATGGIFLHKQITAVMVTVGAHHTR